MLSHKNPVDLFFFFFKGGPSLHIRYAHPQLSGMTFYEILLVAALLCSLKLMCIYVILDLL